MSDTDGIFRAIPNMPGFYPTLVGTLVLALLLLFFEDLTGALSEYLVPSLVVYVLGSVLIGCVHLRLYNTRPEGFERISNRAYACILIVHVVWLGALIAYNFWKGVL